jgi:hypothetical protein
MAYYSPAPTVEEDFVNLVRLELDDIKHTFFKIGFRLREANNCKYYLKLGFESIEECAEALFGFGKTTTYDLMRISQIFANREMPMQIDPHYEKYSQSQLVLFSQINLSQKNFISMASPDDSIATLKKAKNYWNKVQRGSIQGFLGYGKCNSIDEFIERIEAVNPELKDNPQKDAPAQEYEQLVFNDNSGYPEKLEPGQDGYLLQEAKKLPKEPSFEEACYFLNKIIKEPEEKKKREDVVIKTPEGLNKNVEVSEWDKPLSDHLIKKCEKFLNDMCYKTIFDPDNKGMGVRVERDLLSQQIVREILEAFNDNRTVIKTLFRNYLSERLGQYDYQIILRGNKQGITPFCGTISTCIMDFFFDELTKIKPEKKGKKKK